MGDDLYKNHPEAYKKYSRDILREKELKGDFRIFESYFMEVGDLLKAEFPPVKTYLMPCISEGTMNMVVGPKGCGKTTLAQAIGISLTRNPGDCNIGPWATIETIGVGYIDGENNPRVVQDKIRLLTQNLPAPIKPFKIFLGTHYGRLENRNVNLLNIEYRIWITEALSYNPDIKVLIIDNMSCLSFGRDELKKEEWDPINEWLLGLKANGITTITVAHTGKDARLGARGTSGMGDSMDCIIQLTRPKGYRANDKCYFQIDYDKNPRVVDIDTDLSPFTIKLIKDDNGGLVWTSEVKPDDDADKVLACLIIDMYRSKRNQTDISKIAKVSQGKVSKKKTDLIDGKFIDEYGRPEQKGLDYIEDFDFSRYYGEDAPF
jgi:hypothetical protein